jgi:PhnB protein
VVAGTTPLDGYHTVNPYIVVAGVERMIGFLDDVFGAIERGKRELSAEGAIEHAEVQIGDSVVMLSEASAAYPARPCVHYAYVLDVDAVFDRAMAAGASPILAPAEQTWGDRVGGFHDPCDNRWWVANRRGDEHQPGSF